MQSTPYLISWGTKSVSETNYIDIIAEVADPILVDEALIKVGYRYKGEYNLPLRRLYDKEGKIYLHIHEIGSPEVESNLIFRDDLRQNTVARCQYETLKIELVKDKSNNDKVPTGISRYN